MNPNGYKIPKFVLFSESGVDCLLVKKTALSLTSQPPHRVVQRFIVPRDFIPQKLIVHWSKTAPAQVYAVTGRSTIDCKAGDPSVNPKAIASVKHLNICDVRKEDRAGQDVEALMESVRSVVERYALSLEEQLEELVFTCMPGLNGKMYLLNCKRVKAGTRPMRGAVLSRRASMLRPEEVQLRSAGLGLGHNLQLNSLSIPVSLQVPGSGPPILRRNSYSGPADPVAAFVSKHITAAAESLDRTSEQARELKQAASALVNRVKLMGYPTWFVPQCISRAYDDISREPRLMRYFGDEARIGDHLKEALQMVFVEGCSQAKVKTIHKGLGVREEDFHLYLKSFETALSAAGATAADQTKALSYLSSFKNSIVSGDDTPRRS